MNRLLLVVVLFISNFASAGDSVIVTGTGKTFDEAKQQAFRQAVELSVGVTVLSDIETKNYQRHKDDIYLYSAGYVDNYKILRQENINGRIRLTLDVSVNENNLKNRILSYGNSTKEFDGEKHSSQISTYLFESHQRDKLLNRVLVSYPYKAYNLKQFSYTITFDYNRVPLVNILYELSWNYDFIQSLRQVTNLSKNCTPAWKKPCSSVVTIMAKDPKDLLFGSRTDDYYNDFIVINILQNHIAYNSPKILIKFLDSYNNFFYGFCHTPQFIHGAGEGFYNIGKMNQFTIYGNSTEKATVSIPASSDIINKTSKIELSVGTEILCKG